jgi:hypothetical protein
MKRHLTALAATLAASIHLSSPVMAQDTQGIREEIQTLRQSYETRISQLESRLRDMEGNKEGRTAGLTNSPPSQNSAFGNRFNPSVNVILNGRVSSFSRDASEIAGLGIGEEGERSREGLSVGESELSFSANVDDKFYGSLTAAIVREGGEDKIELEEAYFQTLSGAGLPEGSGIKAGRAFWTLGYLNEHHTHTDDFADRPLPYRVFLNNAFNDDGAQFSYLLPTHVYGEVGGGVFRGDDFPAGGSVSGLGAWSAYARVGSDIGSNQSWRFGAYVMRADVNSRASNEDTVTFIGQSRLYATDLRYTWAPTGNPRQGELTLQGEYFHRSEDGTYEDTDAGTGAIDFDGRSSGWYVQSLYKFAPAWRVGARYARMHAPDVPAGLANSGLDSSGHDPVTISIMGDWTNSEFARIRLQYNREELSSGARDNQVIVQYIMSIGAHGAHAY